MDVICEACGTPVEIAPPFERARAELGRGRCLVALGRTQESAVPLLAARDGFGALLATPWIECVKAGGAAANTS